MNSNFPPIGQHPDKKTQVEAMFDSIAPRYDLLNRILSFGIDQRWRKKAISMLRQHSPESILDVATGTGDLAIMALKLNPREIIGVDIAEEMLRIGRAKIEKLGASSRISLVSGDSEQLPFPDDRFAAVTVAFGVRNFGSLQKGLSEMRRVLRRNGIAIILEFSSPENFILAQLYRFYSKNILPRVGSTVSGDKGAYEYLPASVKAFPDKERFLNVMEECGYHDLSFTPLTGGIATIYKAKK